MHQVIENFNKIIFGLAERSADYAFQKYSSYYLIIGRNSSGVTFHASEIEGYLPRVKKKYIMQLKDLLILTSKKVVQKRWVIELYV